MKIRGTAFWTSIQLPNTKFDPVWCIDLAVDAETSQKLKEAGLKARKDKSEDGRDVFKFTRKTERKYPNGQTVPNDPPVCLGVDGKPTKALVGNGSEVFVQINIYEWSNAFGSGVGADFQGLRIIDLVEFKAPDGAELLDDDEDGAELMNKKPAPPAEYDDALPDSLL